MTTKNSKEVPKIQSLENLGNNEIVDIAGNIINNENPNVNFDELNNLCDRIIQPKDEEGILTEWSEEDAIQFAEQFIHYADDTDIDFDKIDFTGFDEEYFKSKYPKFDDIVYEKLAEYSKKKLEDHRQKPLTIQYGSFNPFKDCN